MEVFVEGSEIISRKLWHYRELESHLSKREIGALIDLGMTDAEIVWYLHLEPRDVAKLREQIVRTTRSA